MQHQNARQKFLDLQLLVDARLRRANSDTKSDMKSLSFFFTFNYMLSIMLVIAGFIFVISPKIYRALQVAAERVFAGSGEFNDFGVFVGLTAFLSILLMILLYTPAVLLLVRFKNKLNIIYFVQSSFVVPIALVVAEALLLAIVRVNPQLLQAFQSGLFLVVAINILYALIDGLIYMYVPLIPGIFLAILYGTTLHNAFKRFPSHDSITFSTTKLAEGLTCNWEKEQVEGVIALITAKREGLNGQSQAISFILAAIALAGLVGIDNIASVWQYLFSAISQLYNITIPVVNSADNGASILSLILTVALSLLLLYIVCSYFSHSYNTLRVLEIMAIACEEKKTLPILMQAAPVAHRKSNDSIAIRDRELLSQLYKTVPPPEK